MTEPQSQELRKEIEKAVKKFLEAGGDPEFYIISKSYYDKNIEKLIQTQADKKMLEELESLQDVHDGTGAFYSKLIQDRIATIKSTIEKGTK